MIRSRLADGAPIPVTVVATAENVRFSVISFVYSVILRLFMLIAPLLRTFLFFFTLQCAFSLSLGNHLCCLWSCKARLLHCILSLLLMTCRKTVWSPLVNGVLFPFSNFSIPPNSWVECLMLVLAWRGVRRASCFLDLMTVASYLLCVRHCDTVTVAESSSLSYPDWMIWIGLVVAAACVLSLYCVAHAWPE